MAPGEAEKSLPLDAGFEVSLIHSFRDHGDLFEVDCRFALFFD